MVTGRAWLAGIGFGLGACAPGSRSAPEVPASIEMTAPVPCVEPRGPSEGPFELLRIPTAPNSAPWVWGGGLLVAPLAGRDEPMSVWVTAETGIRAFVASDEGLTEVAPPPGDTSFGAGLVAADYDADGDLDVFVSRWGASAVGQSLGRDAANRLLRHDGCDEAGCTFTDVTQALGVEGCLGRRCARSVAASFGDADRDGDLDLFLSAHGPLRSDIAIEDHPPGDPAFFYRNDGQGLLVDATASLPASVHHGYTLGGGFHDLDRDGFVDLYLVNDVGTIHPNVVVWGGPAGLATGRSRETGLDVSIVGMGLAAEDLNGDGRPDLVMPAWNEVAYLQSAPGRDLWVDAADATGLSLEGRRRVTWGAELADLDNDQDLDLVVAAGWVDELGPEGWPNPLLQPDLLWENVGTPWEPGFELATEAWDVGRATPHRAYAAADVDRNGFLDLLVHNLYDGELLYYRARCGPQSWLRVQLSQPGTANLRAIGARIAVWVPGGVLERTIRAGGTSLGVGLPAEIHVGLGSVEEVGRVEVTWPDGAVSVLENVPTRRTIRVVREEAP